MKGKLATANQSFLKILPAQIYRPVDARLLEIGDPREAKVRFVAGVNAFLNWADVCLLTEKEIL